jgi:TonB-dependent receptor
LRIEDWKQDVTSYDIFDPDGTPISSDLNYTDYLPSVNLMYAMKEEMNLRAAFSQTLTRPFLRELALVEYTDFIDGIAEVGNPMLKRTLIQNYDLRWEYYRRPGELFAVSLGYKHFKDPIEKLYVASNNRARVPANIDGARNFAVEFEMRSSLDVLGDLFANFNLTGNLALINSQVDIGDSVTVPLFVPGEDEPVEISTVQTSPERALEGQSPYVANLMLGYRHPKFHTDVNILYNVFGRRINTVGSEGLPDIYEEARHEVDLTMSQPIAGRLGAKFKARNLLDAQYELTQGGLPHHTYSTGRSFSFGISYKL